MNKKFILLFAITISILCFTGCLSKNEIKTDMEKCKAIKGNLWIPQGKAQIPTCVKTFSDGKKPCTTSSECQGECIVTNPKKPAVCAKNDSKFGCHSSIEDFKKQGGILCVD